MAIRLLNALLDVVAECQAAAQSLTKEQAAEGLASADDLLARLKQWRWERWDTQAATMLQLLPREVLLTILGQLEDRRDLAHLAATCCLLWCDAPAAPVRLVGPVEAELRRRAEARSLDINYFLPEGAASWVPYLLKREFRDARRRLAPLAAGMLYSVFVDTNGRLLTCGQAGGHGGALGHTGVDAIGPPTLVPSMLDRRIVSVASNISHCLALSAEGEVFSWGAGDQGALGHGDENHRAVPSRIESLQRIESIMAGNGRSAAVDERGHLFTCGLARTIPGEEAWPTGLGYAVDLQTVAADSEEGRRALAASRGGRRPREFLHPGRDRRRRRLFLRVRHAWRARPRLVEQRDAATADRCPDANGAAVRRRGRRRLPRPRPDRGGSALLLGVGRRQQLWAGRKP